jgi:hypothetical protein
MIKQFDCKKINGFCAIATLANVLRDDAILEYIDSEEFIPSGHRQLSEILHREGYHDFFISPIIQFQTKFQSVKNFLLQSYLIKIFSL